MVNRKPEYELTDAADSDLLSIARYTIRVWGIEQAHHYDAALGHHFKAISKNQIQRRIFLKQNPSLLFSHCEHHYIFYLFRENNCPLIIAVFHENMNLAAQIKRRLKE